MVKETVLPMKISREVSDGSFRGEGLHRKLLRISGNGRSAVVRQGSTPESVLNSAFGGNQDNIDKQIDDSVDTYMALGYINSTLQRIDPVKRNQRISTEDSSSPLSSLTYQQLADHLISLRTEYIQKLARPLVMKLVHHPKNGNIFNAPVDPTTLNLPTYYEMIACPMDLGTIKARLQGGHYHALKTCFDDVRLVFHNAIHFNGEDSVIGKMAAMLLEEFESEVRGLEEKHIKQVHKTHSKRHKTTSKTNQMSSNAIAAQSSRKVVHECSLCLGAECLLCGEKCLKFESPNLFCQTPSCLTKIKKNATYYISSDACNIWCQKCYQSLPSIIPSTQQLVDSNHGETPLKKRDLLRRKFDEQIAEPWVQCDQCEYWFHQICALFIPEKGPEQRFPNQATAAGTVKESKDSCFLCPLCMLENAATASRKPEDQKMIVEDSVVAEPAAHSNYVDDAMDVDTTDQAPHPRSAQGHAVSAALPVSEAVLSTKSDSTASVRVSNSVKSIWRAADLPRSPLGDFLESIVKELLITFDSQEVADTISVRVVSNIARKIETNDALQDLATCIKAGSNLVKILPYRQKVVHLYQTIDGIDVELFSLYVQEFDSTCAWPNNSTVYIAYLDSIDYFRPLHLRSLVYQELVAGYLLFAKARGFKQCHFWACPPQRGDNFIFWCHPHHQKTPSRDRLNAWYHAILARAKQLQVHNGANHMWNLYFSKMMAPQPRLGMHHNSNGQVDEGRMKRALHAAKVVSACMPRKHRRLNTNDSLAITTNTEGSSSSEGGNEEVLPPYPPIFEGDFWIVEYLRLYNTAMTQKQQALAAAQSQQTAAQSGSALLPALNTSHHGQSHAQGTAVTPSLSKLRRSSSHASNTIETPRKKQMFSVTNWERRVREILKAITVSPLAAAFRYAVDPIALNVPNYFAVITQPMDLSSIRAKLGQGLYVNLLQFASDVRLTFANAKLFNPEGHPVHNQALQLGKDFERRLLLALKDFGHVVNDDPNTLPSDRDALLASIMVSGASSLLPAMVDGGNNAARTHQQQVVLQAAKPPAAAASEAFKSAHGQEQAEIKREASATQGQTAAVTPASPSRHDQHQSNTSILSPTSDSEANQSSGDNFVFFDPHTDEEEEDDTDDTKKTIKKQQTMLLSRAVSEDNSFNTVDQVSSLFKNNRRESMDSMDLDNTSLVTGIALQQQHEAWMMMNTEAETAEAAAENSGEAQAKDAAQAQTSEVQAAVDDAQVQQDQARSSGMMMDVDEATHEQEEDPLPVPAPPVVATITTTKLKGKQAASTTASTPINGAAVAASVLGELSKSVNRLNDDLFVVRFSCKSSYDVDQPAAEGEVQQQQQLNAGDAQQKTGAKCPKAKRIDSSYLPRRSLKLLATLLADLPYATADPDPLRSAPVIDSRHTFLETAQYRQLQFDSLRRAKHSSMVILQSLHRPQDRLLGPRCAECQQGIVGMRWHCEECADVEFCDTCRKQSLGPVTIAAGQVVLTDVGCCGKRHPHPLTPYRVTFP